MSLLIVTSRYLKSGTNKAKTKRSNYTKYIATRESVELRSQDIKALNEPATEKQKQLLNELLNDFPDAKKYLEFDDYIANPTVENASELISTIIERHANVIGNRKNFVGYMAMRPGAERRGEHGLFNDSDDPIDLNAVAKEVSENLGIVWAHVVSLRREDAVRLGYTNSDRWRDLVKRHISDIAQAQNISLADLKWYAAFHDTTHHPHIHLIVYSTNPKEGYLTKSGIDKIRSAFANDIFHDDLQSIYQEQTLTRDELKALSENQMKDIISQLDSSEIDERLVSSIKNLHEQLKNVKGKKIYGYLPKEVKQTVDDIFSQLANDKNITDLYEKWCEFESAKYTTYTQKPKAFPPLTENKEFKSVKNMIIRNVVKMNEPLIDDHSQVAPEPSDNGEDNSPPYDLRDELTPEDFRSINAVKVDISAHTPQSKYTLKWSSAYKEVRDKLYDSDSQLSDYQKAEQLLLSEAKNMNALAIFELGKLYASDKLGIKDEEKSFQYYKEALFAFVDIEPIADVIFPFESKCKNCRSEAIDMRAYVWYRIGRMHCCGLGTKKNYVEAFKWLEKSALEENKYAQIGLASLYYYGKGVEQSYKNAFEWYHKSAEQGQPYAAYAIGQMYSKGEYVAKDDSKAKNYYKKALSGFCMLESKGQADEKLLYKIGRMYMLGLGTDIDMKMAMKYLLRAAKMGEPNAKRCIAQEYISGDNIEQNIDKGIQMLTELADSGDTLSAHKIGKIYFDGNIVFRDLPKAEKYLQQAVDDNNEYAMYTLAKLYLSDEKYDLDKAVALLDMACNFETIKPFAAYTYSKILLDENEYHDTSKAVQLLSETVNENCWCSYLLGKLYLFENADIQKDRTEAEKWLTKSAEDGNEYAELLLLYAENNERSMITNTVASLLTNLGRIIEEDNRRSHKNISRADRKLMSIIQRKKQELGIKSDGTEMQYEY